MSTGTQRTEPKHAEGAARTTDGGRPLRGVRCSVTRGQEALACSALRFSSALGLSSALLAAATGAGLAAS